MPHFLALRRARVEILRHVSYLPHRRRSARRPINTVQPRERSNPLDSSSAAADTVGNGLQNAERGLPQPAPLAMSAYLVIGGGGGATGVLPLPAQPATFSAATSAIAKMTIFFMGTPDSSVETIQNATLRTALRRALVLKSHTIRELNRRQHERRFLMDA